MTRRLRVALVYPPFGPAALPSLGLGLLAAALRSAGHECRTFYWNLDLVRELPHTTPAEQLDAYRVLSERTWWPYTEWVFGRAAFGAALAGRDEETLLGLLHRASQLPEQERAPAETLLGLQEGAAHLVDAAARRVAGYDVVGIATTFFQNVAALALARRLSETSDCTVVLGGANCDGEMGRALLELSPSVDAVLSGEADNSFPAYVEALAGGIWPGHVPGLTWRTPAGAVHSGPDPVPVTDLDALPVPDYDDWVRERERVGLLHESPLVVALESSRGCWWGAKHHCTFCGLNANGMAYRRKGSERFLPEVQQVVERTGAGFVFLTDNILAMDYLGTFLEQARASSLGVEMFYEVKANLRRDQVRTLALAGVTAVQPGVESLSSDALRLMRKGVKGIQNVAFVKHAQEHGVHAAYNLLVGFPGEDPRWYHDVVDQLPRLAHLQPPSTVTEVEYHRFSPYHRDPAAFGLVLRPLDEYAALYPVDEAHRARLAYMFQDAGSVPSGADSPLAALASATANWCAAYRAGARLTCQDDGPDIVVRDTRPTTGPRTLRLLGFAASAHRALVEPRSLPFLLALAEGFEDEPGGAVEELDLLAALLTRPHEIPVGFGVAQFRADPLAALALLSDAGLLYEERSGGRPVAWLALALPSDHAPLAHRWELTGV